MLIEKSYSRDISDSQNEDFHKPALLVGGGIGDFLHYIVRIDDFLHKTKLNANDLIIYVESTNPAQIEELFRACLAEFEIRFVPKAIHWTKTNPLLRVNRKLDQRNRPAYLYTQSKKHKTIFDWFLPFVCSNYHINLGRLEKFLQPRAKKDLKVLIAARDKGFLWWPSKEAHQALLEINQDKYEIVYTGTLDEKPDWIDKFTVCDNVACALKMSIDATLFVGTDTGLATVRELLGLPNLYCINEYWFKNLMLPYKYWSDDLNQCSKSKFAFDMKEFKKNLQNYLSI